MTRFQMALFATVVSTVVQDAKMQDQQVEVSSCDINQER